MSAYGISGNLLTWISSFVNNRSQSVRVGHCYSDFNPVISGVPQGSVLGPLLFLLYINGIVDLFGNDLTVTLFADDVKMYVNIYDVKKMLTYCRKVYLH